ncbi:hypothetical protein [Peterkaempfera griseoplana]|uniref:hypothetical protein n=1 Tax=Peterkaempfera griseoplana TaxID=66896 RepID=UPI0012FE94DA|nr:hypothetical protein [Peterkaempfera griseoplana]
MPGVAALSRGWLPWWLRGHVSSPRLWGGGEVTLGLGVVTGMISWHGQSRACPAGLVVGLCLLVCGAGVLAMSQRPRRAHRS